MKLNQTRVYRHTAKYHTNSSVDDTNSTPGGGGGGTQIWFRRGCAAEAAKPVPIFKGHFGEKGTHY